MKRRRVKKCERCPTLISAANGRRRYCSPCGWEVMRATRKRTRQRAGYRY